jgi:Fe-S cluster assembly protein SufD
MFTGGRLQLVIGAGSEVRWITTYLSLPADGALSYAPLMDLFLDQRARCSLVSHLSPLASHWCFDGIRAYLKADASFNMVSVLGGSKTTRHHARVQCAGENSEADLKGLWMLRGAEQAHVHATVDHSAPHTRSMQLFKGVLSDAAQSSFEGKIIVQQPAQKTQAYQLNKHLLLGKAALAQSKPNLEIHADDVKASHGSTIAKPDARELFYLQSRGITEEKAQQLLVEGFCREILDLIHK